MTNEQQKEMNTEQDNLNLPIVDPVQIDVSQYVGRFVKIEKVELETTKFGPSIKISTEVVEKKGSVELRGSRIYSLTENKEIVRDSKLHKLLLKYGVASPADLIGKPIQLLKKETDRGEFLTF